MRRAGFAAGNQCRPGSSVQRTNAGSVRVHAPDCCPPLQRSSRQQSGLIPRAPLAAAPARPQGASHAGAATQEGRRTTSDSRTERADGARIHPGWGQSGQAGRGAVAGPSRTAGQPAPAGPGAGPCAGSAARVHPRGHRVRRAYRRRAERRAPPAGPSSTSLMAALAARIAREVGARRRLPSPAAEPAPASGLPWPALVAAGARTHRASSSRWLAAPP